MDIGVEVMQRAIQFSAWSDRSPGIYDGGVVTGSELEKKGYQGQASRVQSKRRFMV